ncbi:hypothetical protein K2X33_05430 [bacterium]|nr:hypothetical protein [bacterium]
MLTHPYRTATGVLCLGLLTFAWWPQFTQSFSGSLTQITILLLGWTGLLALGITWPPLNASFQENWSDRRFAYRLIVAGVSLSVCTALMLFEPIGRLGHPVSNADWAGIAFFSALIFTLYSCPHPFKSDSWYYLFAPLMVWLLSASINWQAPRIDPAQKGRLLFISAWAVAAFATWWSASKTDRDRHWFVSQSLSAAAAMVFLLWPFAPAVSLVPLASAYTHGVLSTREKPHKMVGAGLIIASGAWPLVWIPWASWPNPPWPLFAAFALHAFASARTFLRWIAPVDVSPPKAKPKRASLARPQTGLWETEEQIQFIVWQIPAQTLRALGDWVAFWSEGGTAYLIFVILGGLSILLWAALKTQVLW